MKILMLHGINHNMFGKRDPLQYGTITLEEIDGNLRKLGAELGAEVLRFKPIVKAQCVIAFTKVSPMAWTRF